LPFAKKFISFRLSATFTHTFSVLILGLGLVMMTIGAVLAHAGKLTDKLDNSPEFSRRMGSSAPQLSRPSVW
jgi:hypothetical protein